jgi:Zn-dependent protease with chaperone function
MQEPTPAATGVSAEAGAPPLVAPEAASFYDGSSSRKRGVTLEFGVRLGIHEHGRLIAAWEYSAIHRVDSQPGLMRLSCEQAPPLARLEIRDPAWMQRIAALCPALDAQRSSGGAGRIVAWSLAALVSIIAVIMFGVPLVADRLTPLIPAGFEKRLGQVADNQVRAIFDAKVCAGKEGNAAFAKLVEALRRAGGLDTTVESAVVATSTANAIALPGGKIYLFDGLLKKAESVDEIAGVLAHELGHVHHRDHLRAMIHNGGTSFLLGLLFGDITGSSAVIFASRTLFDASYSRDSETDADTFAIGVMRKLGRSPRPMGELLFRVTGKEGSKNIAILSSHPLTEDRLERMKREDQPGADTPLLTDEEWKALKAVCATTP